VWQALQRLYGLRQDGLTEPGRAGQSLGDPAQLNGPQLDEAGEAGRGVLRIGHRVVSFPGALREQLSLVTARSFHARACGNAPVARVARDPVR